jgi:tetratricopeptide (TPR) repeat protein
VSGCPHLVNVSLGASNMDEETLRKTVKALVKAKRNEKALGTVGMFLAELGQADSAAVAAYVEQGYIYYKMKRFRDSLRAYYMAIELDDQSGHAWAGRTVVLYELRRYQESDAAYRRARNLAPQDARSLNGLGMYLITIRQYESALIALDRAEELDPFDFDIAQNRLFALRKLHRYRQFFHDWIHATLRIWRSQREQEDSRKGLS